MAKKKRRRLSPILARVAQRAMVATKSDIETYQATEDDVRIAEAMVAGHVTVKDITQFIHDADPGYVIANTTVGKILRDPITCAWINQQVHKAIGQRLGQVDASMMNQAVGGNVPAARLLYDRYGEIMQRTLNMNVNASVDDLQGMTTEQIEELVRADANTLHLDMEVIDAETGTPENPNGNSQPGPSEGERGGSEDAERAE